MTENTPETPEQPEPVAGQAAAVADDDHREGARVERMGPEGPGFGMPHGPGR